MNELMLDRNRARGDRGKRVQIIQEWLCLHGIGVVIDGKFGPATDEAVRQFQRREELAVDGIVGPFTYGRLVAPMAEVLCPMPAEGQPLGDLVVRHAERHLAAHPREVGGQNRGPWVRLYMKGKDGTDRLWCAGFTCFLIKQAAESTGTTLPFAATFSCDELAEFGRWTGRFLKGPPVDDRILISPGSLFLSRKTANDWTHTGIVLGAGRDTFQTIEGNTNDDGKRDGYEVCRRVRGYAKKDFIVL